MSESDTPGLSYALITPARDEESNLPRLARSLIEQTVAPSAWLIVDNGSTDQTRDIAASLCHEHPWIGLVETPGETRPTRGGPVVRAFHAGFGALPAPADVVVKLDADVSLPHDHFESLLRRFAADEKLGIAGGMCYELVPGSGWRPRPPSGDEVRGAVRAYRWACAQEILPLDARMGWDGLDALKARMLGWKTKTFADISFRHHRDLGEREVSQRVAWAARGRASYYMGYRPSYLFLRALHQARREPVALSMISGYAAAALRREPRYSDVRVRAFLRGEQRLRNLRSRVRAASR
ncbi:MAG: glycosyltransferase [Gaiellaceae bacterium]